MKSMFLATIAVIAVTAASGLAAAELPAAPPVSHFAPAADLAGQVEYYMKRLEAAVQSEEEYKDSQEKVLKDANTMALIALALGLHDQDNDYKAAAAAMVKASQELAAAKDFATARAGVEALKAALKPSDDPPTLKWEKVASLEALMKQVPLINSRMGRYLRRGRFKKSVEEVGGYAAVLAVIAQGAMANADETEKPGEVGKWYQYCARMRDTAGALNKAIHDLDEDAVKKLKVDLTQSCDECHEVFKEEEE